jgi:transposase
VSQFSSEIDTGSGQDAAGRGTQGAVGEQRFSSGVSALAERVPNPELVERAQRRKFTARYKLAIVAEADAVAGEPGGIGALLRREGLYSSHLGKWRAQRDAGALGALEPRRRGPQKQSADRVENVKLRAERDKAVADLVTARRVIEVQGKVSALLEELLSTGATETETDAGRSQR